VPVVVTHPGLWIAVGIEEPAHLVSVEGYPLLRALLSAVAAEARAKDVSAPPRAELSPAAQTFGDGKPRFHARAFFSRELTRRYPQAFPAQPTLPLLRDIARELSRLTAASQWE
jgi:hypothetical protein